MYRKVLIGGITAAAIVGAGGTAVAVTGSDSPAHSSTAGIWSEARHGDKHAGHHAWHRRHLLRALGRVAHGQFTVKAKNGTFVTHDVITGTVTSVSPTSITVQAADKITETYAVSSATRVFQRAKATPGHHTARPHERAKSSIGDVTTGDRVFVAGTGTTSLVARRILDIR